jgi:hypothetical protein
MNWKEFEVSDGALMEVLSCNLLTGTEETRGWYSTAEFEMTVS